MLNIRIGKLGRLACAALIGTLAVTPAASADDRNPVVAPAGDAGVIAKNGMVVAQDAPAARIGVDILQKGGNAVDAAVAVGFALAVAYPRAGNIGGGGFMVIHLANGDNAAIDYRETAPAAINARSFLDANGNADPQKSRDSALAIGVPGTVAGLALAERTYGSGRFTLADLIAPALAMARGGVTLSEDITEGPPNILARLAHWPSSAKIFLKADGSALSAGDRLVQNDLADTLATIARDGPDAFYDGPIAQKLAAAVQAAGGVMTADDLKNYRAIARKPVRGSYRGYDVISMPPPSSGGVELIEMLNILEGYDLAHDDQTQTLYLLIEAMKRAYADRALFLGDPDRVQNPVARLISKEYAAHWRATIDPAHATPASAIRAGNGSDPEGHNTTHFSIVDRFGNAVSNTYTLNFAYGVGLVAGGTGVLLNNELDDFAAKPDAPNAYGLVGFEANEPGPGKRPLSSMTPTIVLRNGKPFLVTGSPGGSRITTTVLQVIVNVIDRGMSLAQAIAAPRVHNQWLPDQVFAEPGVPGDVIATLQARGDKVVPQRPFTSAESIVATPEGFVGVADPRTPVGLAAGY
ncbi:MAG TPA: gamma-glutamyltransferase [Xanthobacteraceae bacterium]|jgi:gamma-glutamyltranspeptidase/glutathione hydrolase|nr:gamma-glutamyltransferase [Xanthobacteraceae bacterium]